jgi:hypothetical protein
MTDIAALKDRIAKLTDALETTLDERDELAAKCQRYEGLLESIADERGLLGVLQRMAHDERMPLELRVKAASAGLAYERPKLSFNATANIVSLASRLDNAKVIEQPKPAA